MLFLFSTSEDKIDLELGYYYGLIYPWTSDKCIIYGCLLIVELQIIFADNKVNII